MTLPNDDENKSGGTQSTGQPDDETTPFDEEAQALDAQPGDEIPYTEPEKPEPDFDFPRMDDDVAAFRRQLDAIQPPSAEHLPEVEPVFSTMVQVPRRRRRSARSGAGESFNSGDLGARLESIVQRVSPTFDFFLFSLVCGCILAIGYALDAPAILIIGIFLSPLLGPWVGATLSAATGEFRLFRQTFGGLLTSLLIVFAISALGGLVSRLFQPLTFSQAYYHARLWWPDLLLLVIGTILLVISFTQSEEKPIIASLMVAYAIYLPVGAAGFGLGSAVHGLWPQAGLVFLVHLALSLIISLIMLFYMGFRPLDTSGYVLTIGTILAGLVILAGFAGLGSLINVRGDQAFATSTATAVPTRQVPAIINPNPTIKPVLTASVTPSFTPAPSPTFPVLTATLDVTPGPTLLPTPVYGRVESQSGGVMVRVKPGGTSITTVQNGYLVEIQSDAPVMIDGATWVHVIIKTPSRDIDGWVLLNLIVTATPSFSP